MASPDPDLRTLATVAAHDVDCPGGARCHEDLTTDGRYGRYADAVLAAVLPEHRRVVLAEAAEAAIEDARSGWPDGHTVTIGYDETIEVLQRLAAAAPPAGLSAPVPAGTAPAVPEEADGQRAAEGPYRVGRKVGRTIYRMAGNEPSDTDELIGVMDSPALAAFAVRGMNADTEMESERDRLARELYEANCELAVLKSKPLFSTRQVMRVLLKAAGDEVTDQELTLRIDDGLTLAGAVDLVLATLALTEQERLWSRRAYEETKADRDRLAAQVDHHQRVVEAAKAWRGTSLPAWQVADPDERALIAAVDALPDAGTDQTEDNHG